MNCSAKGAQFSLSSSSSLNDRAFPCFHFLPDRRLLPLARSPPWLKTSHDSLANGCPDVKLTAGGVHSSPSFFSNGGGLGREMGVLGESREEVLLAMLLRGEGRPPLEGEVVHAARLRLRALLLLPILSQGEGRLPLEVEVVHAVGALTG